MDTPETRYKQGKNPNSLRCLRKFKEGNQAAVGRGRPHKEVCLVSCIKEELAKLDLATGLTNEQVIAAALTAKARKADLKAIDLTLQYTARKPDQGIKLVGELTVRWDGNRNSSSSASETPTFPSG